MSRDEAIKKSEPKDDGKKKGKLSSWFLPPVKKVAKISFVDLGFFGMLKVTYANAMKVITGKIKNERTEEWQQEWKKRWGLNLIGDDDLQMIIARMRFEIRIFGFFVIISVMLAILFATVWTANGWSPVFFSLATGLYLLAPMLITWWRYHVITENKYTSFMEWISRQ